MSDGRASARTRRSLRSEGFRAQVRGWFTSTGAAPAWALVGYMVCGLVVGAALTGLLPDFQGTLLGALAGVIVAAAGSGGPSGSRDAARRRPRRVLGVPRCVPRPPHSRKESEGPGRRLHRETEAAPPAPTT
jgi:hypothetical protein